MSLNLTLPDDVMSRLREVAGQRGVSIEGLIEQIAATLPGSTHIAGGDPMDDELLVACTRALLEGTEPPITAAWKEIEETLLASEPIYPTVEEAMSALRGRPWSKDG